MAARARTSAENDAGPPPPGATARTIAVQVIAVIVIAGVAHLMAGLVVPLLIAMVLAICLSAPARRLESIGLPPTLSSLLFTGLCGALVLLLVGLLAFQANAIAGEIDGLLDRLGDRLGGAAEGSELGHAIDALGSAGAEGADGAGEGEDGPGEGAPSDRRSASSGADLLGRAMARLGRWLASGIGGLLGVAFGAVVGLIALFLMLRLRGLWIDRLLVAADHLGLCVDRDALAGLRRQVVTYLGVLGMIASGYVVLISLLLWGLGVPRPLLWGVLGGMMEFIPIFGPMLSGTLVTLATLTTGALWKPVVVAATFMTLHAIEGYVIWPVVFGRTIRFDQVTILVGILFFGGLLGPLGMVLGMPLMILLRGLIAASPDTPALDALAEVEGCAPAADS